MKKNSHSENLSLTISLLEARQEREWAAIKHEIDLVKENLKPLKIAKTAIEEIKETIGSKSNLVKTLFGFGAGYLSRKLVFGKTQGPIRNIIGSMLSYGVSKFVNTPSKSIH